MAISLPPVAVLAAGRPFTALLNLGLIILLWVPGVFHALFVVSEHKPDKRTNRNTGRMKSS